MGLALLSQNLTKTLFNGREYFRLQSLQKVGKFISGLQI